MSTTYNCTGCGYNLMVKYETAKRKKERWTQCSNCRARVDTLPARLKETNAGAMGLFIFGLLCVVVVAAIVGKLVSRENREIATIGLLVAYLMIGIPLIVFKWRKWRKELDQL